VHSESSFFMFFDLVFETNQKSQHKRETKQKNLFGLGDSVVFENFCTHIKIDKSAQPYSNSKCTKL